MEYVVAMAYFYVADKTMIISHDEKIDGTSTARWSPHVHRRRHSQCLCSRRASRLQNASDFFKEQQPVEEQNSDGVRPVVLCRGRETERHWAGGRAQQLPDQSRLPGSGT